ncbi:MurT ligase domain-containing protein [Desulfotomaculum varum]
MSLTGLGKTKKDMQNRSKRMNIRLIIAVLAAKLASFISRRFGGRGSSLPGVVARKIYPGVLTDLARQVRHGIIMVTGTNGKTTTNNMIAEIMKSGGFSLVINREGANLITGVTTAFIRHADWLGRVKCDYALLEVDEASLPKVIKEVQPQLVVVNNFFRDQLDRYGELDKTVKLVSDALQSLPQVHLVLNADDPLVAQLSVTTGHTASFFGLAANQRTDTGARQTREARFCPRCGQELHYLTYQYSQLGTYTCPHCGFQRPTPQVEGVKVTPGNTGLSCRVRYAAGEIDMMVHTQGFYNLYNALAAFTVGCLMNIEARLILEGLLHYQPAIGRMETFRYNGKPVLLNLVKNPTGYNEGIATLVNIPGTKNVFMAVNDNDADGRDISWLWDVDFEYLAAHQNNIEIFVCSGLRGEEMALRLKYAGVPLEKITVTRELAVAIKEVLAGPGKITYLYTTYTALWPTQKVLCGLAVKEDLHAESLSPVS